MRKISKTRPSSRDRSTGSSGTRDAHPLRIPGATITAWSDSLDIDLNVFFAQSTPRATVAGADSSKSEAPARPADRPNKGTVSLSDGTRITFATASQFDTTDVV